MTVLIIRTLIVMLTVSGLRAQAPQFINFQGRVTANGVDFDGSGAFKFALVDAAGDDQLLE